MGMEESVIRRSKKARQRQSKVLELDRLARLACFERDNNVCVRCHDVTRNVQWCHVIGRRHKCTRWELDNALTMCAGCHLWWHEYPTLSGEWFRKNWPERHESILALFNAGEKVDLEAKLAELTATAEYLLHEPIKDAEIPF